MPDDVWLMMKERGLQRIPILDEGGRPVGIIIYARNALQILLGEVEDEDALPRDWRNCGREPLGRRQTCRLVSRTLSPERTRGEPAPTAKYRR